MATFKFLLQSEKNPAQIYLRVNNGDTSNFKRKTGHFINPKFWDKKDGKPVKGKKTDLNNLEVELNDLRNHVMRRFNEDFNNKKGEVIDGEWLDAVIKKYYNRTPVSDLNYLVAYGKKYVTELQAKPRTAEKYHNVIRKLEEFESHQKRKFLIKDMNLDFRKKLHHFLLHEAQRRMIDSTAQRFIKFVKTIVFDARNNGYEINPQVYTIKAKTTEIPNVSLTKEEIQLVRNMDYPEAKYDATRDWLIISCYTAQRSSDLLRMNKNMIQKRNNVNLIELKQVKTEKPVYLPIHPVVKEILDKRNGEFPPIFSDKNDVNTATYNKHLKVVCRRAGIDAMTEGNLKNPETGEYGTGMYPKWMLVTSHIGRKSFATNFYAQDKYPTPLLMNVTGHSTEKNFLRYNGNQSIDYASRLNEIWMTEYVEK